MASTATPALPVPVIGERNDIHKSCKSLETVANALNEYCQAANTFAVSKKRLSKSLREIAGMKCTNGLAANSLFALAGLFESLADVDFKLVRIVDKEYDSSIADLKKWFKKLAKEESSHVDKISASNAKLKQAGLAYEKKVKRKDRGAAEEHARYINVLNVVGQEMSQENYDHSLFVTQRHLAALYTFTSSISRIVDAAWLQSCESVRKYSTVIGQIGEYRAFLDGGWNGSMPDDLPGNEPPAQDREMTKAEDSQLDSLTVQSGNQADNSSNSSASASLLTSFKVPPTEVVRSQQMLSETTSRQQTAPPTAFTAVITPDSQNAKFLQDKNMSVRSIETLSSFPTPPAYFPLPDISTAIQQTPEVLNRHRPQSASEEAESLVIKSPAPASLNLTPALTEDNISPPPPHAEPSTPLITSLQVADQLAGLGLSLKRDNKPAIEIASSDINVSELTKKDGFDSGLQTYARSPESHDQSFGRTESAARTGSKIAALRDRWIRSDNKTSTLPKDIPPLTYSVSHLASRYSPIESQSVASRQDSRSIPAKRPSLDNRSPSQKEGPLYDHQPFPSSETRETSPASTTNAVFSTSTARKRTESLKTLSLSQQETDIKERELDLAMRAYELERDRVRLLSLRTEVEKNDMPLPTNFLSTERPMTLSQPLLRPRSQYSLSTTNLIPPAGHAKRPKSQYESAQPHSQPNTPILKRPTDHAVFCGCEACSIAHYSNPRVVQPSAYEARPPEPPLTIVADKPKGWIRRLSMPIINGIDSKRSPNGLSSVKANSFGVITRNGSKSSLINIAEDGRVVKSFEQDATGGISNVQRPRKISFSRR